MSQANRENVSSLLVESLQALESAVDGLYRLGIAIRQSSSGSLTQRIQSFIEKMDDGSIEDKVYLRIKHCLTDQSKAAQTKAVQFKRTGDEDINENRYEQVTGPALSLCRQLAVSVSFRYYGILYRRIHKKKLAEKRQSKPDILSKEKQKPEPSKHSAVAHRLGTVHAGDKEPTKSPPRLLHSNAVPSESKPTTPHSKLVRQRWESPQSHFNGPVSEVSVQLKDVEYPDPPKVVHPATEVDCPYCCRLHSKANYENKKWWRQVIIYSYSPYVSMFLFFEEST